MTPQTSFLVGAAIGALTAWTLTAVAYILTTTAIHATHNDAPWDIGDLDDDIARLIEEHGGTL